METTLIAAVNYGLMFVVKKLYGLQMKNNGASATRWLRVVLVLFSVAGVVATNALQGTPLDFDSIGTLVGSFVEAIGAALASHGLYKLTVG